MVYSISEPTRVLLSLDLLDPGEYTGITYRRRSRWSTAYDKNQLDLMRYLLSATCSPAKPAHRSHQTQTVHLSVMLYSKILTAFLAISFGAVFAHPLDTRQKAYPPIPEMLATCQATVGSISTNIRESAHPLGWHKTSHIIAGARVCD